MESPEPVPALSVNKSAPENPKPIPIARFHVMRSPFRKNEINKTKIGLNAMMIPEFMEDDKLSPWKKNN